jgi:carboxylesterase type B
LPGAGKTFLVEKINNDAFYRMPTVKAAEAHSFAHPGRAWHYQVDYQSALPKVGAIHAIDVALLFRTEPIRTLLRNTEETSRLSSTLRDAVVSFAKTGKPAAPGMPPWAPYEKKTRTTMIFDEECRAVNDFEGHLRRYWK